MNCSHMGDLRYSHVKCRDSEDALLYVTRRPLDCTNSCEGLGFQIIPTET